MSFYTYFDQNLNIYHMNLIIILLNTFGSQNMLYTYKICEAYSTLQNKGDIKMNSINEHLNEVI